MLAICPSSTAFGRKEWGWEQKAGDCRAVHGSGEGLFGAASSSTFAQTPVAEGQSGKSEKLGPG